MCSGSGKEKRRREKGEDFKYHQRVWRTGKWSDERLATPSNGRGDDEKVSDKLRDGREGESDQLY